MRKETERNEKREMIEKLTFKEKASKPLANKILIKVDERIAKGNVFNSKIIKLLFG